MIPQFSETDPKSKHFVDINPANALLSQLFATAGEYPAVVFGTVAPLQRLQFP
jgi:hypothetical protein